MITLTMSPFVVPAGGEVYRCQDFANPFGGEGAFDAIESHLTAGSHHLFVFYRDGLTNGPVEECSGLEFSPGPFATQLRDERLDYPPGIAAMVAAGARDPAERPLFEYELTGHFAHRGGEASPRGAPTPSTSAPACS